MNESLDTHEALLTNSSSYSRFWAEIVLEVQRENSYSSDETFDFNSASSPCPLNFSSPRNTWDDDQRLLVVVLRRFYDTSWDEITRIFNHRFREHLRACGFAKGIPRNRIVSQYMDLSSHRVRKAVFQTPFENVWYGVDKYIHEAAQELQIKLVRRTSDVTKSDFDDKLCGGKDSRKLSASQRKTLKSKPLLDPRMVWGRDKKINCFRPQPQNRLYGMEIPQEPATLFARCASTRPISLAPEAQPNQLATPESPRISTSLQNIPMTSQAPRYPIPPLLYRTYCKKNAGINQPTVFVAGQFTQLIGDIPQPISTSHSLFQAMLENHVNKRKILGPFISLTDSLLWAVFLASKSPEDAHVAVIETKNLRSIYPISDYMQGIPLELRHRKYKGTCEYLVWGKMSGSAIRGDFTFLSLNKAARTTLSLSAFDGGRSVYQLSTILAATETPLSKRVGATIGRIVRLMGLNQYTECEVLTRAVECIIQGWSFTGPLNNHIIEAFIEVLASVEEDIDPLGSAFGRKNGIKSFQEGVHRGFLDLDGKKARMLRPNKHNAPRGR